MGSAPRSRRRRPALARTHAALRARSSAARERRARRRRVRGPGTGYALAKLQIAAVAVDPHGYIPRVEFYEGDRLLGFSEIAFIQPPPDGTPISHEFTWNNAPVGRHVLTAQAVDSSGNRLVSDEVKIVVGTNDGLARIEITHPDNGDFFRSGTPIKVEADAVDPEGYIPRVEFYAAERLIGVSEIAFIHPPPDGTSGGSEPPR